LFAGERGLVRRMTLAVIGYRRIHGKYMLPNDEDAVRLSQQTYLLPEFLEQRASDFELPELHPRAIVQGHCHHKAVFKLTGERKVLERLGLNAEFLNAGCCGMAGSFGFEKGDKYDVSIQAGERALLPQVRETPKDTIVLADGFSCREQISQRTDRQGLHIAQVIQLALHGDRGSEAAYPEHHARQLAQTANSRSPRGR